MRDEVVLEQSRESRAFDERTKVPEMEIPVCEEIDSEKRGKYKRLLKNED